MRGILSGIMLAATLLLAACAAPGGNGGPPATKPGAFELTGSIECAAGVVTVNLDWTAASGATSYVVLRDGEAVSGELNAREFEQVIALVAGSVLDFVVRAGNAQGTTDSNPVNLTVPECQNPAPGGPVSLSVGSNHTLVALFDGSVISWGVNNEGKLGRTGDAESLAPGTVPGLQNVKQVAAGTDFSLALDGDGNVWSWGSNEFGQLGTGDGPARHTPVQLDGFPEDIRALAAGGAFAVALGQSGKVYGWGRNNFGQLGSIEPESSPEPVEIDGVSGVEELAAGGEHVLARLANGTVMAWGAGHEGQLGHLENPAVSGEPAVIPGLEGVVQVAAGERHSLAVTAGNVLHAWGNNYYGQLGNGISGSGQRSDSPIVVDATIQFHAVYAGGNQTIARGVGGTWYGWGENGYGQLGDGTTTWRSLPTEVLAGRQFTMMALGDRHSVAVDEAGEMHAWGRNLQGELGLALNLMVALPTEVPELTDVLSVATAAGHTLALTNDGHVYAWGMNDDGQLGLGDQVARYTPTRIPGLEGALAVAAGNAHSLVLLTGGTVLAFGSNTLDTLGVGDAGTHVLTPTPVPDLTGVTAIAAASGHSFALLDDATLVSWGSNASGQLGIGTLDWQSSPVEVSGLTDVVAIATALRTAVARDVHGAVHVWGDGRGGQLGSGSSGNSARRLAPGEVQDLEDIDFVGLGHANVYAIQDGLLQVWGSDAMAALGNGTVDEMETRPVPQADSPLANVVAVAGGEFHALALQEDGRVFAWGGRQYGQVGDGVQGDEPVTTPVEVLGGVEGIVASHSSSFAIMDDGSLLAWGHNNHGQLGLGSGAYAVTPQPVDF